MGEELMEKILSIPQKGTWTAHILSANGSLYNATVRRPCFSDLVTYEGCFEIISLSGSFSRKKNGVVSRGHTILQMSGLDNQVFGGEVAGTLIAASRIEVVVGTFRVDCPKKDAKKHEPRPIYASGASASDQGPEPTSKGPAGVKVETLTFSVDCPKEGAKEHDFKPVFASGASASDQGPEPTSKGPARVKAETLLGQNRGKATISGNDNKSQKSPRLDASGPN